MMSVLGLKYSGLDAKTKAIYGKRLHTEDYQNLVKMKTVSEIAAYLKKHPGYSEILQGMQEEEWHRGQLEEILRNELTREFSRILNFVSGKEEKLLYCMVIHLEIEQIMDFVRKIISPESFFSVKILPEIAHRSDISFEELKKAETLGQLIKSLRNTRYYASLKAFDKEEEGVSYSEIETALRSVYFKYILKSANQFVSKSERERIKSFLAGQIDLTNFSRILRCKRYFAIQPDAIAANLLPMTGRLDQKTIQKMIGAPTWQEAYDMIKDTGYKKLFEEYHFDMVEQYYYEYIWKTARKFLFHSRNSICVPYAYLNVKQIEIKNLINIIEGVRYQVDLSAFNKHLIGVTI